MAIGTTIAAKDDPWWHLLPFVALTLLLLGAPALTLLALGPRGERFLPKARDWMTPNSWIVNEVVLVFFVVTVGSNLA